jgi:hypothetical protein
MSNPQPPPGRQSRFFRRSWRMSISRRPRAGANVVQEMRDRDEEMLRMLGDEISVDLGFPRGPQALCVVCRRRDAPSVVCPHCYDQHGQWQSQAVWKSWIDREQKEYYGNGGCTSVNLNGQSMYIQTQYVIRPELFLLKRVKACIGWAIHGLLMEFADGTRVGYVVDLASIRDDAAIAKRNGGDWVDIDAGDYVTNVQGFHLSRNCFLCHTLHLKMASGRTISMEGTTLFLFLATQCVALACFFPTRQLYRSNCDRNIFAFAYCQSLPSSKLTGTPPKTFSILAARYKSNRFQFTEKRSVQTLGY